MKEKVLITGATGATGSIAIETLLKNKVPVRALVHSSDARSQELAAKGVEVVEGDLSDLESVSAALKGISAAYFMYPVLVPGILDATAYFAQAALEENLKFIVNMSQVTARREAHSHGAQNHWVAERLFDRSGIPVTHLRPGLFAEWLMYFSREVRDNDRLISPFGSAAYAPIAGEDIGRVIANILMSPEAHIGKTYPLYGPEPLTQQATADILSEVLGRKITYVPMDIDVFAEVSKVPFSPYFIQHISKIAVDFRNGEFGGTNDQVEKLTGLKPLPLIDYIKKNIGLFTSPS